MNEMTVTLHATGETATARRYFTRVSALDVAGRAALVDAARDPQWSVEE